MCYGHIVSVIGHWTLLEFAFYLHAKAHGVHFFSSDF